MIARGVTENCQNGLCPEQFAAYYVRESLKNPQGDVLADGRVNLADAVYMQRYLLCALENAPKLSVDWESGDINGDGSNQDKSIFLPRNTF